MTQEIVRDKMDAKNFAKTLNTAITMIDQDLRSTGNCQICGKPLSGVIPSGQTAESAGLCCCPPAASAKSTHGGLRAGSGRKARYGTRMTPKTIRLPQAVIDRLIADYGSLQKAIEHLVSDEYGSLELAQRS